MIQINLLPISDIRRRDRAKKELFFFGIILIAYLVFIAALAAVQFFRVKTNQSTLAELQTERSSYDGRLREVAELRKEIKKYENYKKVIEDLQKNSPIPTHVLDEIAKKTPADKIWLTELEQNSSTVKITGMSQDNQTIAKYMQDLESSDFLTGLELQKSDSKQYAGSDLKAFTLTATIVLPELLSEKTSAPSGK